MIEPTRNLSYRVGLLTVVVLTTFVALLLGVVGVSFGRDVHHYGILFDENVKGMVVGSKVNFQGVPVGAVRDIAFRDGFTEVSIELDPSKAEIQQVTVARLDRLLVTGQVTVELEGYERGAPRLAPGSRIPARPDPLSDLKASLPDVVGRVEGTLMLVDRLLLDARSLFDEENRARAASILRNLEQASADLPPRLAALLDSVDNRLESMTEVFSSARDAVDRLAHAASSAGALLEGSPVEETLRAVHAAALRLEEVERGTLALLREGTALLTDTRVPLESTVLVARESMRELRELARALRFAPTSLIQGATLTELELPAVPAAPSGGAR